MLRTWGASHLGGQSSSVQHLLQGVRRQRITVGRTLSPNPARLRACAVKVLECALAVKSEASTESRPHRSSLPSGRSQWQTHPQPAKLLGMQRHLEASHGAFAAILDNGGVAARVEICFEILHVDLDPPGRHGHLEDITVPPQTSPYYQPNVLKQRGLKVTWGDSDVGGDSSHVQDQLFEVPCAEIRLSCVKLAGMAVPTACCWHLHQTLVLVFGRGASQLSIAV